MKLLGYLMSRKWQICNQICNYLFIYLFLVEFQRRGRELCASKACLSLLFRNWQGMELVAGRCDLLRKTQPGFYQAWHVSTLLEFIEKKNVYIVCCYLLVMSSLNSCGVRWKFLAFIDHWIKDGKQLFSFFVVKKSCSSSFTETLLDPMLFSL